MIPADARLENHAFYNVKRTIPAEAELDSARRHRRKPKTIGEPQMAPVFFLALLAQTSAKVQTNAIAQASAEAQT